MTDSPNDKPVPPEAAPEPAPDAPAPAAEKPLIKAGNDELYVEARGAFGENDVKDYVPSPESDQLRVNVSQFEGPLDLLLHLIEKHALQVFDIPIKVIVAEYMKVLDQIL